MTSLNPLAPVTDYQSTLNRIFWFTSASALVATWMLRMHNSALNALLSQIDFRVELDGSKTLSIPGGYLIPALTVGVLTRIYRIHARISDWLGIRECFDIEVIIHEFAFVLGIDLTSIAYEHMSKHRPRIMRAAFYPFVSGFRPAIDKQLIQQALDAWSWFWVGIETTLVFTLTALGLIAGGAHHVGLETLGATLVLTAIGLPSMRRQCRRYAIAQVRAIVAEPARAAVVRAAFSELTSNHIAGRLAA
jgi:hypothetical protein